MLSLSHAGTIKLIDNIASSHDEDVLRWSQEQQDYFEVIHYIIL